MQSCFFWTWTVGRSVWLQHNWIMTEDDDHIFYCTCKVMTYGLWNSINYMKIQFLLKFYKDQIIVHAVLDANCVFFTLAHVLGFDWME